jgi:hypothetical protein
VTDIQLAETDTEARDRIARIEQRMHDAAALRDLATTGTDAVTETRQTVKVTYPSYDAALTAGQAIGARRADDNALMALFCDGPLQRLVGAVSPELVWDGAQKQQLTMQQLAALANSDVMAVSDLQWL